MKGVAIVGVGLVTSLGGDVSSTWTAMLNGKTGIRHIQRFSAKGLPAQIAAMADDNPEPSCGRRSVTMGVSALDQAIGSAGLIKSDLRNAGFFFATPTLDNDWASMLRTTAGSVDDLRRVFFDDEFSSGFGEALVSPFDPLTPPTLVNTACASGATALEMAFDSILDGEHEIAVAAGSESSVCEETIAKFCLLSALSIANEDPAAACRPFSQDRNGFVLGEGAGALVLASDRAVNSMGLRPLARLRGVGNATDGFHRTRSNPDGSRIVASMRRAINSAGLTPLDISHINAHGTGTPENDKMESLGIRQIFGSRCSDLFVTSNKSMLGHTMTAAGVVEAIVCVLTIQNGIIPPTLNYINPDPDLGVRIVGNFAEAADVRHVLSNSFGFGGQNVSLVFSHPEEL